jgi:hypothetical protein
VASLASPSEEGQNRATEGSESDQPGLVQTLTDELVNLRAHTGLVFEQVSGSRKLKEVAQAWKQGQPKSISSLDDTHAAIEMVKIFLEDARPIENRDSLKVTYGLIVDGPTLAARVRRYLERPMSEKTVYSEPTIDRRSKKMATQLATKLASIIVSDWSSGGEGVAAQNPAPVTSIANEPLLVQLNTKLVRFGPNRVIRDILTLMNVQAAIAGEHTRDVGWEYYSDHSYGAVEISPEFGCEAAGEQIFEDGIAHITLRIPKHLEVGESHLMHSSEPASPGVINLAPISDFECYILRVQFHQDAIPGEIWRYDLSSHYQPRHAVYRKQTPLSHDGSRFVSVRWDNIKAGRSYGIAWDWPQMKSGFDY